MTTQALAWYQTTIGKKVVVALTGLILFGYLVAHMLGNLQVFAGREVLNAYGAFLHGNLTLLWGVRIVLLVSVVAHIAATAQLFARNRAARPERYRKKREVATDYASRTMYMSGPIIAAFVIYHVLHLTTGHVGPPFVQGDVYANVVNGFRVWYIAGFYILAMTLLAFHLYHGLWSFFQTLGLNHPKYNSARRIFAQAMTLVLYIGFISVPVAVLTGVVR
jgi:succinate dehydrogenase / fumarate reductase cytochrome b subunit